MKRLFDNAGDVNGSQQYGIGIDGDVGGDVNANISVTSTSYSATNTSTSYRDSHDVTSHQSSVDSHDVTSYYSYSSVDSHDVTSYTSITDSHDSYSSVDSHDTTNIQNINASFTSTGQAAAFGIFFGNGLALRAAVVGMVAAGILTYIFLEEIVIALAAITAVLVAAAITTQVVKRQRRIRADRLAYIAWQEEQAARTQFLAEERAFQLQLAAASRPVYIVANSPKELSSAVGMLEDRGAQGELIEIVARPQLAEVRNDRRIH